jgi:hypothetical protein
MYCVQLHERSTSTHVSRGYESVYKEGLSFSCCLFFFSLSCNVLLSYLVCNVLFILRIYCLPISSQRSLVERSPVLLPLGPFVLSSVFCLCRSSVLTIVLVFLRFLLSPCSSRSTCAPPVCSRPRPFVWHSAFRCPLVSASFSVLVPHHATSWIARER